MAFMEPVMMVEMGKAQEKIQKIKAGQLEKQGIADKAQAVQAAKQERLKADMLESRVTALTAKTGSAVSSVDIQNTLSSIDEQGEYNALAQLYSGFSSADSKKYAATVARAEGKMAKTSGYMQAGASIMDSAEKAVSMGYA
jgi:exonuclease I